jgi:hypothetical protein
MSMGFFIAIGATLFAFTGSYFLLFRPMFHPDGVLSRTDRLAVIGFVLVMFFFAASLVGVFGFLWISNLSSDNFWNTDHDRARLIYESRTILGYAETIALASTGIFLPLLIGLWNSAREKVSITLEKFVNLNVDVTRQQRLKEIVCSAYVDMTYLRDVGGNLRGFFWSSILGIGIYSVLLAYANFTPWEPLQAYVLAVVLKALAIVIFLWLLTFLLIYLLLVQPVLRDTAYSSLFEIDKLISEGEQSCPSPKNGL